MKLRFADAANKDSILIIPVLAKRKTTDPVLNKLLSDLSELKEFHGYGGETFFNFGSLKPSWPKRSLLIGLGKEERLTYESVLSAFADAIKTLAKHHPEKVSVLAIENLHPFAQAIAEAIILSNYQPAGPYKTGKTLKKLQKQIIYDLEIIGIKDKKTQSLFEKGFKAADVVNEVRDMVNAPPNFANVGFFERKAKEIAKEIKAKFVVLRKKELTKLGMGAFLSVNRGSAEEARLLILEYTPKNGDKKLPPIALIGKGIVFDSGGYNLKPHGHIENMHLDKAGAVTMLGIAKLLPQIQLKRRAIIVTPFTFNAIGPDTAKPSEIVKTYLGKTVEITNTDAEGRMILCDALAYTNDKYKPAYMIDAATLTGACVSALGDKYAGLFGNDKTLLKRLRRAGNEVDELLWPLPMHKMFGEKMKGSFADLKNSEGESGGGASKGAAFLKKFVGKTKWAHLDIAGPAFANDPKKYECKGATGFGVRLLLRFLEKLE